MKYSLRHVTEAVVIGLLSVSAVSASAKMVQITGTGYNKDVIDEIGGDGSARFFNEDQALYETNYLNHAEGGLPSNGRLISKYNTIFQFAPFTGNNAVIVAEDGSPAGKFCTFTLDDDCKLVYETISILALGAGGQCDYSVVFFFTDDTNTGTGTDVEGRFDIRGEFDGNTLPDWFNSDNRKIGGTGSSLGTARTGVGRVDNGGGFSGDTAGSGVRLQQYNYNLSLEYPGKVLKKIEFEATGGSGKNRTFLAFTGLVADPLGTTIVIR